MQRVVRREGGGGERERGKEQKYSAKDTIKIK